MSKFNDLLREKILKYKDAHGLTWQQMNAHCGTKGISTLRSFALNKHKGASDSWLEMVYEAVSGRLPKPKIAPPVIDVMPVDLMTRAQNRAQELRQ